MDTVDIIIESSMSFYNEIKNDKNCRYSSWEYCYFSFINARGQKDIDYEYLVLQLAFYLASWGMYRGSSFLLQKDFKIHIPVVKEILKPIYNDLAGVSCSEFKRVDIQNKLLAINDFLDSYYGEIRRSIKGELLKSNVSNTLITKILLGTLGCVPAYDRYFISGIKSRKVASGIYNIKSILQLATFYESNFDRLEAIRYNMLVNNLLYPPMKLIDMGFWKIGYNLS